MATGGWGRRITLIVGLAASAGAIADWQDYPGVQGPGHAGIVIGDYDGDGHSEAVVTAYTRPGYSFSGSQLLAVLAGGPSSPVAIRAMTALPNQLTGALVPAPKAGAADRIAAVVASDLGNQIVILGGVPLQVLRTIQAPMMYSVTAIADVDGDGDLEIVGLIAQGWTSRYPIVMDYASGAIEWVGTTEVSDLAIAQLDADAPQELILAATPGRVLDGATHAIEWSYPSGFGTRVIVGHFDANPAVQGFATSRYSDVQVFRSQPYSPVSELTTGEVAALSTVRMTAAGPDLIGVGNGQWGAVSIYDPRSGQAIRQIQNPEHGVSSLAVGDIDGDGSPELVYGSGLTSSGGDLLRAVDLTSLLDDYSQYDEVGPYAALSVGAFGGAETEQLAYLTVGRQSGYGGPILRVLDFSTGARLRMREDVLASWGWNNNKPLIDKAKMAGSAGDVIVVAGDYMYDGMVAVLDGVSLDDIWRISSEVPAIYNSGVMALAHVDVTGDGTDDIVVATSATRIVVLNGTNGALLWQSVTLNGDSVPPQLGTWGSASTARAVVARGAALYVFNLSTHLLENIAKTTGETVAMRIWGDGAACRIAAMDAASIVTLYRCADLSVADQRLMPPATNYFEPLDSTGNRFVAAAGTQLYEVAANGSAVALSPSLGAALGAGNRGRVLASPDGQHVDVAIGSDYMVTRRTIGLDRIMANGFDSP